MSASEDRPRGIAALGIFFFAGATISLTSAISLLWKGSPLEPMWRLNPRAHQAFLGMGAAAAVLLFLVSAACLAAGIGLWRGAARGRWIAIALLAINLAGDIANTLLGTEPRAAIGIPIAGLILGYLFTRRVQRFFH